MADGSTATETAASETTTTTTTTEQAASGTAEESASGASDAEKWKALSRKNEAELRKARAELEQLRTATQSDHEKALAKAREEGKAEVLAAANQRLLRAEVRSLAAGKLADPNDAVHFLDLDEFEIKDNGSVDAKAIGRAIDQLLKDKPYLGTGAPRSTGSGDGGARGSAPAGADMNALLRQATGRA